MTYAQRFTKEELIRNGFEIKVEGGHLKIYKYGIEYTPSKTSEYYVNPKIGCNKKRKVVPYYTLLLYAYDKNGNKIKKYKQYKTTNWVYKVMTVTLQRAVWAWYNGEVPEGMLVDHINNKHDELDDYLIDKLQLLTPFENIHKDSSKNPNRMVKCSLKKPLSHFEDKLAKAMELCKASTGLERHKYINECARYRANIRYWKAHHNI